MGANPMSKVEPEDGLAVWQPNLFFRATLFVEPIYQICRICVKRFYGWQI